MIKIREIMGIPFTFIGFAFLGTGLVIAFGFRFCKDFFDKFYKCM